MMESIAAYYQIDLSDLLKEGEKILEEHGGLENLRKAIELKTMSREALVQRLTLLEAEFRSLQEELQKIKHRLDRLEKK